MSGLEKFQANDAWRSQFKKFLLVERKATAQLSSPVKETQRFSLDFVEDLQIILEEKKIPRRMSNSLREEENIESALREANAAKNMFHRENKENVAANTGNRQTLPLAKIPTKELSTLSCCNDTMFEEDMPQWQRTSEESFEALEKMCNKTASDPDSTLFQYLHSENKEQIVSDVKKRSAGNLSLRSQRSREFDAEADALQRLLDELNVEEQKLLANESPLKGVDVTQLDDIEAPSRLWENTIVGETVFQTSPVKMVGLLRPSTIIEECADESNCSDISSQMSFQSAFKGASSEVSSSCYETAHDSHDSTNTSTSAAVANNVDLFSSGMHILESNGHIPIIQITPADSTSVEESNAESFALEQTINLIDLEQTFSPLYNSPHSSMLEDTLAEVIDCEKEQEQQKANDLESDSETSSIIEILSDDDDTPSEIIDQLNTETHIKHEKISLAAATFEAAYNDELSRSPAFEDNKENCSQVETEENGKEKSLHFNDTMEEVEYMMKKGMEYMAAAAASTHVDTNTTSKALPSPSKQPLKTKQNTFLLSPRMNDRYRSPSPMLHKQKQILGSGTTTKSVRNSPRTLKTTPIAKPKPVNQFARDMKPIPKLDVFRKPAISSGIPTAAGMRHKELAQKHFSHIVSPIGAYMKKTATTPLMTSIRTKNKNADVHNSSAFRELEYESRLYHPKFESNISAAASKLPGLPSVPRSLPKKAYISSEFKQIVDERTPVTIPGGKKIQKYLETAMLPAVVRHDGKLKLQASGNSLTTANAGGTSHIPRRADASLADLSLMSGDVSMYTIMDAQKF